MSTGAFNDEETTQIMRYLGYPDWSALAQSVQLGYPAASEPMFLAYDSLKRVTPTARAQVRRDVVELQCIEDQLSQARGRLGLSAAEGVKFNHGELRTLRTEYINWKRQLADDLGVPINPYALTEAYGFAGGVNGKVIG